MAGNCPITTSENNADMSRETVPTVPSVEHTVRGLKTIILTFCLCKNSFYHLKNVASISRTSSLRAAGAAGWSTDTLLAAGLVVGVGEQEAVQLQLCVVF